MTFRKPAPSARYLLILLGFSFACLAGTIALAGTAYFPVLSGIVGHVFLPLAEASTKNETLTPQADDAGGPNSRLIYGMGDLPLIFPQRRDRVILHDPVNGPQTLAGINDFEPAWSPDGRRIAFVSLRDGPEEANFFNRQRYREIYIMNTNGSDQQRLGGVQFGGESQPSFSPDGQNIVFVSDRTPGGGSIGIYRMDTLGNNQTLLTDTSECYDGGLAAKHLERFQKYRTGLFPGIFGPDTPNYSPDGQYIIFGNYGDNGTDVYRINADGSGCMRLYQAEGSYYPTQARYSPNGQQIALYHQEDIIGGASGSGSPASRRVIRIIDANDGTLITEHEPQNLWSNPVWSPDGSGIGYFGGYVTTDGDAINTDVWTYDLATGQSNQEVFSGVQEAFRGLSWGTPSTFIPPVSVRINDPNPLTAGRSTTGTVYLSTPAPAGGTLITLTINGAAGIITLPQSSLTVPQGETQATFTIDSAVRTDFRSADVRATRTVNFASGIATVSVSPSRPDLRVTQFTTPPSVGPGASFQITSTVENIGPVTTGASFTDNVYFSLDDQLDAGDGNWVGTTTQSVLAAAGQSTKQVTVNIPFNRVPSNGTYYLIYDTNTYRTVNEGGALANNIVAVPIEVVLPDLVPENLNAPTIIEPGVNFNVTWNIRNAGGAGTSPNPPYYTYDLSYSFDETIGNADDIVLVSLQDINIPAGAVRNISQNVNIPTVPARPSSSGRIYARVDVQNVVVEGLPDGPGETNNLLSAPVLFEYNVADLQVPALSAPAEVDSDTPFAVSWTTSNTGTKNAPTFSDRVYFSADNQVGGDTQIGSFSLSGGIAQNTSVDRIQNVSIPTNLIPASGNFFIYVKTDGADQINEGENEGNNIRFQPVYVRRLLRPDLTVPNVTTPDQAFFDQTIQVQWTVTNAGPGPTNASTWSDGIYIGTNPAGLGQRLLRVPNTTAIEAGGSYVASATIKIPRGLTGTYYIKVRTDDLVTLNEESAENNVGTHQINLNVPPLPDLTVSNVQAPIGLLFAGGTFQMTWQVNNVGTSDAQPDPNHTWYDRLYLSRDQVLNTSEDRLIFTGASSSFLPAGGSKVNSSIARVTQDGPEYVKLPYDVEGEYYVFAVTDVSNGVYEYNSESNNSDYDRVAPGSPITIQRTPPDLIVQNLPNSPATVTAGEDLPVNFSVTNQGAFSATGVWYDGAVLSNDLTLDPSDVFIGSVRRNAGAAPGSSYQVDAGFRVPACLSGSMNLIAAADFRNDLYEFNSGFDAEANNGSPAHPIQVVSTPPDLNVTNLNVPAFDRLRQNGTLTWTTVNNGTGTAAARFSETAYLIPMGGGSAVRLGSSDIEASIPPSGSVARSMNVTMPASIVPGTYYISVRTDSNDVVPECGAAETNNILDSVPFTLQHNNADLVVDSVVVGPSTNGPAYRHVTWTVRNAGAQPAQTFSGWSDRVVFSIDASYSTNDISGNIAISPSTSLAPGETYVRNADVPVNGVPANQYYVIVQTDNNNTVFEGPTGSQWETNNSTASAPITLTGPAVDLIASNVTVTSPTYAGANATVNYTVTNTGTDTTFGGSWTDYVFLSRDSVLDSTDTTMGWVNRSNEPLQGGQSYQGGLIVNFPAGLTGDYRIFVVTDYKKRVVESSEVNNQSPSLAVDLQVAPPADLDVTSITPPTTASPGESATFNWTVQNLGPNTAYGKWTDHVYLSRDQFWDVEDTLVGKYQRNETLLAMGETYTAQAGFILPPIEEGNYYVLIRTDARNLVREGDESNNLQSSAGQSGVSLPVLTMNTPFATTLPNGGNKFFKFAPPADETVIVGLDGEPGNRNELFTNFGSIVSRADYDFQGQRPREADQENLIANTETGDYYSMVSHDYIPPRSRILITSSFIEKKLSDAKLGAGQPQNITISADVLPFSARTVSPTVAGNEGIATLYISGAKFQTGATAKLVSSGGAEILAAESNNSQVWLVAVFDLKGQAPGQYDVVVTNPDLQTATLDDGFQIVAGGGHSLRPEILGPSALWAGEQTVRYTMSLINDGLNDAVKVPVIIEIPSWMQYSMDPATYREPTLNTQVVDVPPGSDINQVLPLHIDENGTRAIMLMAPLIRARSSIEVGIDLRVPAFAPFEVSLEMLNPLADLADDSVPAGNGAISRFTSSGNRSSFAQDPEARDCWREFMRLLLITVLKAVIPAGCLGSILNGVLNFVDVASNVSINTLSPLAFVTNLFFAVANTAANTVVFCFNDLLKKFPLYLAGVMAFQTAKLLWQLNKCLKNRKIRPVRRMIAHDPNEKLSPDGYGPERFVAARAPIEYRINFENIPEATAPAQQILIVDQIPAELDAGSVRLGEMVFNDTRVVAPPNQAFFNTRVNVGEGEAAIIVDVSAGLDIVNRRVIWLMTAIDPATGEQPLDPLRGLLPPNNAARDGEGYVTFTVKPRSDIPHRTNISNTAEIIFDINEPIVTNATSNLVDMIVPTSSVAPLPATTDNPNFQINWSGTDDTDGSGFQGFDIYVSENGGPYQLVAKDTQETSLGYAGSWGRNYRFYSIGKDNAGNVEAAPSVPDAEITVFGGDTESDVSPRPNGSNGVVDAGDAAQIRRFVAGLDTDFTFNEFQRADSAPFAEGGNAVLSVADIVQARRFIAGLNPRTAASGPNTSSVQVASATNGSSKQGVTRTVTPVRVSRSGNKLVVGVELDAQGDEAGVGFTLNFDPAVLSNPTNITVGSGANGAAVTSNDADAASGRLGLLVDKLPTDPFGAGTQQLLTIEFDVAVGAPPTTTIGFGGGPVAAEVADTGAAAVPASFDAAIISLLGPTSAGVQISGRVLTSDGRSVANAAVIVSRTDGAEITVRSSPLGYYRITGLSAGSFYIIEVRAKGLSFEPRGIPLNNDLSEFDLVADP